MKNIFFTGKSVKRQITDSIGENLTDSDLESIIRIFVIQAHGEVAGKGGGSRARSA